MTPNFDHRVYELERLDTGDYTPREYRRWQREMRYINRFLGDTDCVRERLRESTKGWASDNVSILDVGAGSGDLLLSAGRALRLENKFLVGAEISSEASHSIARLGLYAVQCDALRLPFDDESFDFVISSLFLHHLDDDQAVTLISEARRVARHNFFIVDLHRHPRAYKIYRRFAPIFLQPFTVEDGLLSIRRGFVAGELKLLANRAGVANPRVEERFAYRLVLSDQDK